MKERMTFIVDIVDDEDKDKIASATEGQKNCIAVLLATNIAYTLNKTYEDIDESIKITFSVENAEHLED